jgi:hypothetical protein
MLSLDLAAGTFSGFRNPIFGTAFKILHPTGFQGYHKAIFLDTWGIQVR